MNHPATAREALIVEAIGEVAKLIQDVEALAPILNESCRALQQANTSLRDELAGFERRMAVIAENAKTQAVKYIAARVDQAAGRSIDLQEPGDGRRGASRLRRRARRDDAAAADDIAAAAGAARTAVGAMVDARSRRRSCVGGHVDIGLVRWTAITLRRECGRARKGRAPALNRCVQECAARVRWQ